MDGILFLTRLHDESIISVKVQTLDLWQIGMAVTEEHRELLGIHTLGLNEIAVGKRMGKGHQGDVVGQEMSVGHLQQLIDVQGVAPYGIHTDIGLRTRRKRLVVEGYHLTLLGKTEVVVHILQGVGTIGSRSDTLDHEMSTTVCTRYTKHGLGLESRIGKILVKTHRDTLDGFQIAGVEHIARNLQGINLVARRETISKRAHGVTLVVVADGIAEVDGVGSVGFQRVLQLHDHLLSRSLDLRHLQLWRRDDHFVGGILEFDIFVEEDGDLLGRHVHRLIGRRTAHHLWRVVVIPATIGRAHPGARHDGAKRQTYVNQLLHALSFNNCSIVSRLLLRRGTLC